MHRDLGLTRETWTVDKADSHEQAMYHYLETLK